MSQRLRKQAVVVSTSFDKKVTSSSTDPIHQRVRVDQILRQGLDSFTPYLERSPVDELQRADVDSNSQRTIRQHDVSKCDLEYAGAKK